MATHPPATPVWLDIPEPVRAYCDRAFDPEAPLPRQVRVTQHGEMFREPGGRSMPFRATETFDVERIGFTWRATVPVAPLVTLRIQDGYANGAGWMRGAALGVPFLRKTGSDITAASVLRYLAELPWAPHAMLANRQLGWIARSDRLAEVTAEPLGPGHTVRFHFDSDGDIVQAACGSRPRDGDEPRPWSGTFGDYATIGGVRIPTFAEVRWELPAGAFVYWRGFVTALDVIP